MESNSNNAPASPGHLSRFKSLKAHIDRNAIWLAVVVSVGLHFASVAVMHWKDSMKEPIVEKAQVARVRILANPNGNPNITQTKVVEIAKPKPKPKKKKTQARAITKEPPKEEPAPPEEEVANNLPQSFGDDPTGGIVGTGVSTTDGSEDGVSANAEPIERINPEFPEEARLKGIEGWVIIRFDITEEGSVENVQIVDASPRNLFEREARKAVKRWKYAPRMSKGQAVRVVGREITLDFKLEG